MLGKVNSTQCEVLSMLAIQMIIHNLLQSIWLLSDGCENFRRFCVEGMTANEHQIADYAAHAGDGPEPSTLVMTRLPRWP